MSRSGAMAGTGLAIVGMASRTIVAVHRATEQGTIVLRGDIRGTGVLGARPRDTAHATMRNIATPSDLPLSGTAPEGPSTGDG